MEHLSDKESLVMEFVQGHTMVHLYNNEDNTITKVSRNVINYRIITIRNAILIKTPTPTPSSVHTIILTC